MIKGAAYFVWAPIESESTTENPAYGPGFQVGGLNQVDRNITYAEAELPADNKVKYQAKEFSKGELAVKLSEFSLAHQAKLYGNSFVDDTLGARDTDEAPFGGIGYINTVGTKDGNGKNKTLYRVYINPKTQASKGNTSSTSRGSGITMATEDFSAVIYQPEYAEWELIKEFDTLSAAKGYINAYLGVGSYHEVSVQVNGAGPGEAGAPAGTSMVQDGGTFILTVTGTPVALYDNGEESKAEISAGAYTLENVTEAHSIALIF